MKKKLIMHSSVAVGVTKSALALPEALSSILKECKEYNLEHGITGAIYYNQGYFQQIIEGEVKAVNAIMLNTLKDKRHTDCVIQLEIKINEQVFPNWQRQLGMNVKTDPYLRAFISKYSEQLKAMKPEARIAFNEFLNRHSDIRPTESIKLNSGNEVNVFGDQVLKLKRLPSQDESELPPVMYNLCRLLKRQPQSVDQLVDGYGADKRDNIISLLKQLNHDGLLQFKEDQISAAV